MFKILGTYISGNIYIKCKIWRVAVRLSYIQDARFLKVNGLTFCHIMYNLPHVNTGDGNDVF